MFNYNIQIEKQLLKTEIFVLNLNTVLMQLFFSFLTLQIFFVFVYFVNRNLFLLQKLNKINLNLTILQIITIFVILYLNVVSSENLVLFNNKLTTYFFETQYISLKVNKLNVMFLLTVYLISFSIILFKYIYVGELFWRERFIITLNSFVMFMTIAVLADSWLLFFIAWEGLGVTSVSLITFFKQKVSTFKAGQKANFFNRISDVLLLIIILYFYKNNSSSLISLTNFSNEKIVCCLITIALLKSAQFFFYIWLPDSMDAPTPASALIHSATLVSIGILVLLKFNCFLEQSTLATSSLFWISLLTLLISSSICAMQSDVKKILAYSTITNCGVVYCLISLKLYNEACLYFMLHGIFKSLSFIIAGNLIIENKHKQDLRTWNTLSVFNKLSYFLFLLTVINLCALPVSTFYRVKTTILTGDVDKTNFVFKGIITTAFTIFTINTYTYFFKITCYLFKQQTDGLFIYHNHKNLLLQNNSDKLQLFSILKICVLLVTFVLLQLNYNFDTINFHLKYNNFYFNTVQIFILLCVGTFFTFKKNNSYFLYTSIVLTLLLVNILFNLF